VIGDVELDQGKPVLAFDFGGEGFGAAAVGGEDRGDIRASCEQAPAECGAQAAGAAGDDGVLAGEVEHQRLPALSQRSTSFETITP